MKFGICILVGGKSSRMNFHKAELKINDQTFLERLCLECKEYEYKYISLNKKQNYSYDGYINVYDEFEEIGPMGGIVSCFHQSDVDALFVCSCDMPFLEKNIIEELYSQLDDYEGIFIEDENHLYPTCGIYTRKMLAKMEDMIQNHNYRLFQCIKNSHVKVILIHDTKCLLNINTIEDYRKIYD